MAAILRLYLLGPLDIRSDDRQFPRPPTQKSQSLLAYLVVHRSQPQPRDLLAGLFFDQTSEHKAHRSLSTALWHIHRCLPEETTIFSDSQTVQFDPQNHIWLDVDEFELQAVRTDAACLLQAVTLYRGDFLEGFYDDWIISERYRLESLYLDALARLITLYEAGKQYKPALAMALRLLNRDPLREDAYQIAMRAYCYLGQRKAAIKLYERCRETMLKELGTEPMVETRNLYQSILQGNYEVQPTPDNLPVLAQAAGPVGYDPLDVTVQARLIGREQETLFLEDCWHKAQAGRCILTLISGEGGVGKTRLVEDFATRVSWHSFRVLRGRCYEFERIMPYQPISDVVRMALLTFVTNETTDIPAWVQREIARLAPEMLEHADMQKASSVNNRNPEVGLMPELLIVPGVNPEQALLFSGITIFFEKLSVLGPLLIVLEDLHWASESTLQLLHHLVRYLSGHPILIVGTFNSEMVGLLHPLRALYGQLAQEGMARQLELSRLAPDAIETITREMSGAGESVFALAKRLYWETEGNPFFLMQIIKALFEANHIGLKDGVWWGDFDRISKMEFPLPSSLYEAVQVRVQRLPASAQEGIRLAAVLGREFSYEVLNLAWGKGEEATLEMLDDLLRHRLVEERTGPGDNDFAFTHHKVQEVVYQSLPHHRSNYLHAQAGAAMETIYAAELETRAGELAYHYEQACRVDRTLVDKAFAYLLIAGKQAARQFANQEAIAYYQRGLLILGRQPETVQRMRQEVDLQLALTVPAMVIHGYASSETKRVYDRIRDLCQTLGNTPDLFTSLVGLSRYYGLSGDLETGIKLGEQLLAMAQAAGDAEMILEAYRGMGGLLFSMGRLEEARHFFEEGLALYHRDRHEQYAYRYGHDPAVTCLGFLSMTLWLLGYLERSLALSRDLYQMIPTLTNPSSQAYAYCLLAKGACFRFAVKETQNYAEAAIHLCQLHGLSSWLILATTLKGWAIFEQGMSGEGEALIKQGIDAWQARGFAHFTPFLLALQAKACLILRKLKEGMDFLQTALTITKTGCDRYWLAEINRLQGELILESGGDSRIVEAYFNQSMETARQQGARMLELRAALRLAYLWRDHGKRQAAQAVLASVYDQFTEDLDTCDFTASTRLLQELSE